jgi:hopene-associated glycosyltransferase HpnB
MRHIVSAFTGGIALVAWIYLLLGRGAFWRIPHDICEAVAPIAPRPERTSASVTIAAIIPARDEAGTVAQSLASLAEYKENDLQVFLVDDGSKDGTAEVARATALRTHASDRITILTGRGLPPGWSGKLWAVHQGIENARKLNPQFFLLTDADVIHDHEELSALIAIAEAGNYDLASLMVKLHCLSVAEKLLMPAFVFFFFLLYPPRWISDRRRRVAGAAGGCMLIRPEILERAGGIQAIRNEVIDDCALASLAKQNDGRAWLGLARRSRSIRPYDTFAEIGKMISRTAFKQLHHSMLLLLLVLAGMSIVFIAPVALLFNRNLWFLAMGATTWLMMTAAYLPMVRYYRLNPVFSLTLPFAAVFFAGATVRSAISFWRSQGGEWKGRVQDQKQSA